MPLNAVIFDLDGTLLNTLADIGDSANGALEKRGFPAHPLESYRNFIGDGAGQLIRRVLPEESRDEALIQACLEDFQREYGRNWNVQTKPYPGVPEMLDLVVSSGLIPAVLSNKPDKFTQKCVNELLPKWRFEVILGASGAFPRKPDPAGALEVARRLNIAPAQFLYVGDSGVDMQTAVAAGMFAVGVLWGFRGREELRQGGAQVLIEHPMEIRKLIQAVTQE